MSTPDTCNFDLWQYCISSTQLFFSKACTCVKSSTHCIKQVVFLYNDSTRKVTILP